MTAFLILFAVAIAAIALAYLDSLPQVPDSRPSKTKPHWDVVLTRGYPDSGKPKLLILGRRQGKTHTLATWCQANDAIMLCFNHMQAKRTEREYGIRTMVPGYANLEGLRGNFAIDDWTLHYKFHSLLRETSMLSRNPVVLSMNGDFDIVTQQDIAQFKLDKPADLGYNTNVFAPRSF